MTRYLSEAEAWREIARRIAEGKWDEFGLCFEIRTLSLESLPWTIADAMKDRVHAHLRAMEGEPAYICRAGDAGPRVFAALFLALEAEDEAKAAKTVAA